MDSRHQIDPQLLWVDRMAKPTVSPARRHRKREGGRLRAGLWPRRGGRYLSAQDAVHHDDDEALQRVKHSEEDLEECRAPVGDGQDG